MIKDDGTHLQSIDYRIISFKHFKVIINNSQLYINR